MMLQVKAEAWRTLFHLQVTAKGPRVSEEGRKRGAEKSVKGSEDGEGGGGGGGWRGEEGGGVGGIGGIGGVRVPGGVPSRHRVPIRTQPANHQHHRSMQLYFSSPPGGSPGATRVNIVSKNSKCRNVSPRASPCFHLEQIMFARNCKVILSEVSFTWTLNNIKEGLFLPHLFELEPSAFNF